MAWSLLSKFVFLDRGLEEEQVSRRIDMYFLWRLPITYEEAESLRPHLA